MEWILMSQDATQLHMLMADQPLIRWLLLDLTPQTEGNANGVGTADFTTQRLVDKANLRIYVHDQWLNFNSCGAYKNTYYVT